MAPVFQTPAATERPTELPDEKACPIDPTGMPAGSDESPSPITEKTDWETRIGKRWLTWGGVILLVTATGFLIKYAHDQGWIGPWTQIAIGIAAGCGLCVQGDRQARRGMQALGQGVMGLGLTLVYLACFGAYAYFRLEAVSQMTTLALLACASAAGIFLSNRHRSMPICILAAVGGYLAPILVSTGRPPPVNGLFTYTILVNLGVIGVSMLRNWPALPLLAFGGTVAHFWGWYAKFYQPEQSLTVAVWAVIFHFIFLLLPSLPLLRGRRQTPWQWLLPVANAVLGVYVTWRHMRPDHTLALMLVLAAMAAVHLGIGLKIRAADVPMSGLYSLLGLAVLTLAPPAWFGMRASLICWLALGVLLVEMGCRFDFRPYLGFGYVNLLLGAAWCVLRLWTDLEDSPPVFQFFTLGLGRVGIRRIAAAPGGTEQFLAELFGLGRFWTRLLAPAAWGVATLVLHRWRATTSRPQWLRIPKIAAGVGGALLALIFIGNDVNAWTALTSPGVLAQFVLGYVMGPAWCFAMAAVALAGRRWRATYVSWLSLLFAAPATILIFRLFFDSRHPDSFYFHNPVYFAKLFHALCCMTVAWVLGGPKRVLWTGIAGYLLIATQHSEVYSWAGEREFWLWSVVWSAGAAAYAAGGWKFGSRDLGQCFWVPLATGALFAGYAMRDNIAHPPEFVPFLNAKYLSAMLVAVVLGLKALVAKRGRLWIVVVAGWVALAATHAELYGWLGESTGLEVAVIQYRVCLATATLYLAGALTYAAVYYKFEMESLRTGGLPPALTGTYYLVCAFLARPDVEPLPVPFANMVFGNGMLLTLTGALAALKSRELRVWLGILAGYIFLVATHLEIGYWHGPWMRFSGEFARTAWYTALWSIGAAVYLAAAIRYRRKRIFYSALRVASVALFCAAWQYFQHDRPPYILFLNTRFLISLLALGSLIALCRVSKQYGPESGKKGFVNLPAKYRRILYIVAAAAGFLLLSYECRLWCLSTWGHTPTGRRLASMSLSITWGVYSIFLLVSGFVTRIRGWRLSGLILFAVTCAKLAIVDLARLDPLHRILSFMAVGLLLMASSYMYHRLEKRLKEKTP